MNTTFTNAQITAGAAVLDLDLDELQALCDAVKRPWYGTLQIADGVTDDDAAKFIEAFSPDTVSELIAAVRHAPSPQIAEGADDELDAADEWRRLALQFDGHRMQAMGHLRAMVADPVSHRAIAEQFLSAPPLSGEEVLAERIDAIAASRSAEGGMSIEIKHAPAGKTDFARGEILGYERSPTRFMVVGEDDLYVHTFILGTGMYWGVRKEEPNLACLVRYSAAEGAGQAGQVAMTADELAALLRFYECAADGEGYDVPKPMMRRLSEIGVVQRISGAYYHTTEYGLAVLESAERAAAEQAGAQVKPLKHCASSRDGECRHAQCPQLRDNEPAASGRHCPLDTEDDD